MILLTPHHLAAMYDCLRAFKPFDKWKIPPADEVAFHVTRSTTYYGQAQGDKSESKIWISSQLVGHLDILASLMAHEMLHIHQYFAGTETPNVMHNKDFRRLRKIACDIHGWDSKLFY